MIKREVGGRVEREDITALIQEGEEMQQEGIKRNLVTGKDVM